MPHLLQMDSASKQIQRASVSVHTTPDNLEYQYRSLQMTNILDTVEPDAIVRECAGCGGPLSRITKTTCFMDGKFNTDDPIYSRETVESLLEAHRKQVLLEAAEVCTDFYEATGFDAKTCADELRRMAEGEK